jgi:hypothetical protein
LFLKGFRKVKLRNEIVAVVGKRIHLKKINFSETLLS